VHAEFLVVRVAVGLLFAVSSCASVSRLTGRSSCSEPPASAAPPTEQQIASLVGRFSLTQVITSFPASEQPSPERTTVELHRPDSVTRAATARRLIGRPKNLQLVGTLGDKGHSLAGAVKVDAGTLFIGCRDCNDASPDHLKISAISDRGFWGTWVDYQTGIGRVFGKDGKPLPDPAGYFCALRIE